MDSNAPLPDMEVAKFDSDNKSIFVTSPVYVMNYYNQAFTSTSATKTLSNMSRAIRLVSDQDCYIRFDDTTVTSSNSFRLMANIPETFIVRTLKIGVIRSVADGTLNILNLY